MLPTQTAMTVQSVWRGGSAHCGMHTEALRGKCEQGQEHYLAIFISMPSIFFLLRLVDEEGVKVCKLAKYAKAKSEKPCGGECEQGQELSLKSPFPCAQTFI